MQIQELAARNLANPPLRVVHIVAYRDIFFPRNQGTVRALEQMPDVTLLIAHNRSAGWRRYFEAWHSLRKLQRDVPADVYVFGFRSHEIFWLFLPYLARKPIVFDALMSPYGAVHQEGKLGWQGRLFAPLVFWLERSILRHADLILTDTPAHIEYYQKTFGLPIEKFCAVPVSAPELEQVQQNLSIPTETFNVLFFGSFLPLHGVNVIVRAAAQLRDLPIRFDFVGGSSEQLNAMCKEQRVTQYTHRPWVPFNELLSRDIPAASICLGGPFGGTKQALRVITTKTAQCLAASRATIVGRTESDIGFIDKHNCLLVEQNNSNALADAIRWSFEHRALLGDIGANGRKLYDARLSTRVAAERLAPRLKQLVARHSGTFP
ncbi:glycosyltransferase [Dyella sp.]|uniref:glycosyltransferase n=1 Tax=Dyella sp. TaxID=1869338 RepID=UPI002FD894A2